MSFAALSQSAKNSIERGLRNTNRALLAGRTGSVNISEYRAYPSRFPARKSMRPLRTHAGAPVMASRMRCTPGRTRWAAGRRRVPCVVFAARARSNRCVRSASSSCSARASPSSTASEVPCRFPPLQAGVVVDAHPGEHRHLLPAQPGNAPVAAVGGQSRLLGTEPGPSGGQKLSDLVLVVHALKATSAPVKLGGSVSTCIGGAFLVGAASRRLLVSA